MKKLKPGLLPNGWLSEPKNFYSGWDEALDKFEPAWAKAALAFRGEVRFGHLPGSIRAMSLVAVHETLEVHRRRFESGDTLQLLIAARTCAEENVPMPTWLARAYVATLDSFLGLGGAPSLDTVFFSKTLPTATPKRAAAARQDWHLGFQIMSALWELVHEDETLDSLDKALKRVLAVNQFGVEKTKARSLFLAAEKSQIEFLNSMGSNMQPLSRTFAKRRKGFEK